MDNPFNKVLTSFTQFWNAQEKKRKIIIISAAALIVIAAVVITVILNQKKEVVLFDGLDTSEASQIATIIQEQGYDVTVKSGGKIIVPDGTQDELTMKLAEQGYPKNSLDYTTWINNVDMFSTDYEKREYARIQAQERLAATIETINGVKKAVVNISIPEQKNTVIQSNQLPTTVAIAIHLEKDVKLTNDQKAGIYSLVLNSLGGTGLTEENITLTDGNGVLLIVGEEDVDVVAEETRKFKFKSDMEESIRQKILTMLRGAYGEDGVEVAVNMVLDSDKQVQENTEYKADGQTPAGYNAGVLQHRDNSYAVGSTDAAAGLVGVEPNADDNYPTGTDDIEDGIWREGDGSETYLVSTYKTQLEKQGYSISNLSIAVVVYTDYLSDAQRTQIAENCAMAGGINSNLVSVINLPKVPDEIPGISDAILFGLNAEQLVVGGAAIVVLLIIILLIVFLATRNAARKKRRLEKALLEAQQAGAGSIVDEVFNAQDTEGLNVASLSDPEAESKEVIIRREICEFAQHSPQIVAQLLRNWIREEEEQEAGAKKKRTAAASSERSVPENE